MSRLAFCALLGLTGCCLPSERDPLKPLPEESPAFTYADMLTRARTQAAVALEAFYVDNWMDLEVAAQGLEQTARFLPKATETPASAKDTLAQASSALKEEARRLSEAAQSKNVDGANQAIQRITLQIRTLQKAKQ